MVTRKRAVLYAFLLILFSVCFVEGAEEGIPVRAIVIQGNRIIEEATIRHQIKIRVGEEKRIYKDGKIVGNVGFDRQSLSAINGNAWQKPVRKLKIRFLSPVSIFKDKKHIYAPRIGDIIEYLVHRINRLNKSIWRIDGYSLDRGMFNNGKINVTKYNIYYNKIFKSKGLGSKVELSGFTGLMELSGDLNSIYPLLKAGEVLHIGSRTSYGLGKYELTVL